MTEHFAYTDPIPDDWLRRSDASLLAQVRVGLAQRAAAWGGDAPHFETFGGVSANDLAVPAELQVRLQPVSARLQQALALIQQQEITPVLADSPATRLPVLGWLWRRIRAQAHQLVLFYVNRQAAQAAQINQELLAALTELMQIVAAQQAVISELPAKKEDVPPDEQP